MFQRHRVILHFGVEFALLTVLFISFSSMAEQETRVFSEGNTVYYHGAMDKAANARLFELVATKGDVIEWLSIESVGGEVNVGMDIGEFLVANHLNVRVDNFCLSSCANYVFPAGVQKIMSNDASIAFHGGVQALTDQMDTYIASLPAAEQKTVRIKVQAYVKAAIARENAFYKKLKVNKKINTLGLGQVYQHYTEKAEYRGWYYSPEALATLGVRNITVIDPPWSYQPRDRVGKLFPVDIRDSK